MGCARAKSLIFCSTHMLCLQLEPRYGKIRSDTRHISKVWCGKYIHNDKLVLCAGFWAKCSWIRSFIGVFWSDFHILAYTFQYEKKTKKTLLLIIKIIFWKAVFFFPNYQRTHTHLQNHPKKTQKNHESGLKLQGQGPVYLTDGHGQRTADSTPESNIYT